MPFLRFCSASDSLRDRLSVSSHVILLYLLPRSSIDTPLDVEVVPLSFAGRLVSSCLRARCVDCECYSLAVTPRHGRLRVFLLPLRGLRMTGIVVVIVTPVP